MANEECMSCKRNCRPSVSVQYWCNCDPYTHCVTCDARLTHCPKHPQYVVEWKTEERGEDRTITIPDSELHLYSKACACCQLCFENKEYVKITEYDCRKAAHKVYLCISCHDHSKQCIVDQQYETFESQQKW